MRFAFPPHGLLLIRQIEAFCLMAQEVGGVFAYLKLDDTDKFLEIIS